MPHISSSQTFIFKSISYLSIITSNKFQNLYFLNKFYKNTSPSSKSLFITSVNAHFQNPNDQQNELQVSQAFIQKMTTALSDEWPISD